VTRIVSGLSQYWRSVGKARDQAEKLQEKTTRLPVTGATRKEMITKATTAK
jgi:hypothetical protein